LQLTATVAPPNATNKDLIWKSSSTAIASVDTSGLVTAISAGVATITVTTEDGNKTANSLITVRIPVVSIQVTPTTLTLKEGSQDIVSVVFMPPNATNQKISWSTSNSTVATVSNGVISAHTEGTATITVTAQGGKKASCIVTVMRATNPKQEYYERKYPGKIVIILPEGGALGEAEGDTVIIGSEQDDDFIEFSNGGNIFVYEQNGGHDLITSVNVDEDDRNELHFGPGITSADLTFFKEDNDLYISIADLTGKESGSITIVDWYLAEQYKLAIVFDDDSKLTTEEIEALAIKPDNKLINVTPSAVVEKLTGNKNNLTITIVEKYADGKIVKIEKTFSIDNNSAGIYEVGSYRVFVDTKGNTQIRSCYIVN